jgi:membrane-bound lytic murein transglycosylase A
MIPAHKLSGMIGTTPAAGIALAALFLLASVTPSSAAMPTLPEYAPVTFPDLPGWAEDDTSAAFQTFLRSCPAVLKAADNPQSPQRLFQPACREALTLSTAKATRDIARIFFERHFTPHRVVHAGSQGLLTGYYEPILRGSRTKTPEFTVPLYRRPPDLEAVAATPQQDSTVAGLTAMRRAGSTFVPYYTRAEIEEGALAGAGLEFLWVRDAVELFMLQVQGSGRVRLADGTIVPVGYDGKNGHPYTSIGRYLIDRGQFAADRMSLQALVRWLRADPARGQAVMRQNASYVFFREQPAATQGAIGAMGIPLTPGRSMAIDASIHPLGAPIYVSSPTLRHATPGHGYARLMIAQDVGAAIKGPERGDLFFGTGDRAGRLAGVTKHDGSLFVLLPRTP